jgi:hypothetical protein
MACLALHNTGNSFGPHAHALVAVAALDAVLSALRTHAGHMLTQRHGIGALAVVLSHPAVAHRAASILDVLLAAMETHRGDLHVQQASCVAICSATQRNSEFRSDAGRAGAVTAVVRVLRTCAAQPAEDVGDPYKSSPRTSEVATITLFSLLQALDGHPNQLRALHAGALSLLQAQHPETARRCAPTARCAAARAAWCAGATTAPAWRCARAARR